MGSTRKLAAIMFTDIQGYTALMQKDEAKAMEMRNRHREVFQRLHKQYNGTILQYYGDGTLSVFDSAIDAAQCGVDMQKELQAEPKVPLRIGIHTGDILYSDTEVAGDGINVASRVESIAVPGSVMISEKVYDYIKNQKEIPVAPMGSFNFKNVDKPLEVYALGLEGLVVPKPESLQGKFIAHKSKKPSSVFSKSPFAIIGLAITLFGLAYWAFFSWGPTKEADNSLYTTIKVKDETGASIEKQIVKANRQNKIFSLNFENETDIDSLNWLGAAIPFALEIEWDQDPFMLNVYDERYQAEEKPFNGHLEEAKERRLDFLMKGDFSQDEKGFTIRPMLYNVQSGQEVKSWVFSGPKLLPLLDEASLQIKKDLDVPESHLAGLKDLPLEQHLTESNAAFKQLIEGIEELSKNMGKGIQMMGKSTEIDETFAYANMIVAQFHHQFSFSKVVAQESIAKAMKHRKRLSESNEVAVRMLNFRISGESEKAVQLAQMMADLRPARAELQNSLAQQYLMLGQYENVLKSIKRYQISRDDPDGAIEGELSSLFALGRLEEGIKRGEAFLKKNPENFSITLQLGKLYVKNENYQKAKSLFQKANLLDPDNKNWDLFLQHIAFMEDSASFMNEELLKKYEGSYEVEFRELPILVQAAPPYLNLKLENQPQISFFPLNSHTFFTELEELKIKFDPELTEVAEQMYLSEKNSGYLLCFRESDRVKEAHELLSKKQYQEAADLYKKELTIYPKHYYLENYQRHAEFMLKNQNSWTSEALAPYLGTYSAKEGQIVGTLTEQDGNLYFQQPNFPMTIEPAVLLPLGEEEFMLPNALAFKIIFERKGNKIIRISMEAKGQKVGTLVKD